MEFSAYSKVTGEGNVGLGEGTGAPAFYVGTEISGLEIPRISGNECTQVRQSLLIDAIAGNPGIAKIRFLQEF